MGHSSTVDLRSDMNMDRLELLYGLDRIARAMKRMGLGRVTRLGRDMLHRAWKNGLEVRVDGFRLTGSMLHRGYLVELRAGRKESFMIGLFENAVKPGMTVLDIGAYLGWYMLVAARKVGASGHVYGFEADPRNFEFILRNIETNDLQGRVVPVPKAVAKETGAMNIFLHDSDPSNTSLFHGSSKAAIISLRALALDDYFAPDFTVDVIKMDIEGGEIQALEGMGGILRRSKVVTMFVECHPTALRAAGRSAEELIEMLRSHGFEIQVIQEESRCLSPVPIDIHGVKWVNLYCQKSTM